MTPITIQVTETQTVSGLLQIPDPAFACYVMAHGAGAGMTHSFMAATAEGLNTRGIATLRFQFPTMQNGSKRPDRPPLAHATIRAAIAAAPNLPLFTGGKSFGARMTSQTHAEAPLPNVRALIFFGFPLHPAKKPYDERAKHLTAIRISMLFLQGTRDALADPQLLIPTTKSLGATLKLIDQADHAFHVPAKSGRTDAQVLTEILDATATWMRQILTISEP